MIYKSIIHKKEKKDPMFFRVYTFTGGFYDVTVSSKKELNLIISHDVFYHYHVNQEYL